MKMVLWLPSAAMFRPAEPSPIESPDSCRQFAAMSRLTAFFQLIYDPEKMSESQRERLIRNGRPIICAPGSDRK